MTPSNYTNGDPPFHMITSNTINVHHSSMSNASYTITNNGTPAHGYNWTYATPAMDPFLPMVITYSITFLLGLFGNAVVIFALILDRKGHSVTMVVFISLALADIIFLVVCAPLSIAAHFTLHWEAGEFVCKLWHFVQMLSAVATILNLMTVSVERYIVIVHPIKSRSWCTMGSARKIVIMVWIMAFALASPMFYISGLHSVGLERMCIESKPGISAEDIMIFDWYRLSVMFALPSLLMVFCYIRVISVLWSSSKELHRMTSIDSRCYSNMHPCEDGKHKSTYLGSKHGSLCQPRTSVCTVKDHSHEVREARKQVIRMLITIIIVFLLCWGPKLIIELLRRHKAIPKNFLYTKIMYRIKISFNMLPYIQSCLNPIIYSFMSSNFRHSMKYATEHYLCPRRKKHQRSRSMTLRSRSPEDEGTNGTVHTSVNSSSVHSRPSLTEFNKQAHTVAINGQC